MIVAGRTFPIVLSLICINELDECLSLFNSEISYIIKCLLNNINLSTKQINFNDDNYDLNCEIEFTINTIPENIDFNLNAQTSGYNEIYIEQFEINDWSFETDSFNINSSDDKNISISCYISANVLIIGVIYCYINDCVDKENICIGDTNSTETIDVKLNVILNIARLDNTIKTTKAGINSEIHDIDFGEVEPDI